MTETERVMEPSEHKQSDVGELVERLWALAKSFEVIDETGFTVTYSDGAILVEAAQAITALQAQLDEARRELERLREALERVNRLASPSPIRTFDVAISDLMMITDIARAALPDR